MVHIYNLLKSAQVGNSYFFPSGRMCCCEHSHVSATLHLPRTLGSVWSDDICTNLEPPGSLSMCAEELRALSGARSEEERGADW